MEISKVGRALWQARDEPPITIESEGQMLQRVCCELLALTATRITANYGVYWAGLHFGDVRLVITVRDSDYQMKGDGRFSVLGGLIYEGSGGASPER
jgi:hypothetical protein